MRKLIAGMKISLDGKMEGPEGMADWVEAWSDDYGLMPQIDACVLGGGMYPGYEGYWTGIQNEPEKPAWMTGRAADAGRGRMGPLRREDPALCAVEHPDFGRSGQRRASSAGLEEIAALKQQPGKDIYLVGGARTTASLIDAGLVDELRLIVYPLIAGEGKALFATTERRRKLELRKVQQLPDGRLSLIYGIG